MAGLAPVALIGAAVAALWAALAVARGVRRIASARAKIREAVATHLETLARRNLALVKTDHYGLVDDSAWRKEYRYFIEKVVKTKLDRGERQAIRLRREAMLTELVAGPVERRAAELRASLALPDDISPAEFELWCSTALRAAGWSARASGASGDQGADVIAEKEGFMAVLQCKLHRSPIGNKAVQEAFAARRHHGAQAAAVVSNAGFTRSAEALSRTTGVLLCHYSDLSRFDTLLAEGMGLPADP
jgi:restriction system protein